MRAGYGFGATFGAKSRGYAEGKMTKVAIDELLERCGIGACYFRSGKVCCPKVCYPDKARRIYGTLVALGRGLSIVP